MHRVGETLFEKGTRNSLWSGGGGWGGVLWEVTCGTLVCASFELLAGHGMSLVFFHRLHPSDGDGTGEAQRGLGSMFNAAQPVN